MTLVLFLAAVQMNDIAQHTVTQLRARVCQSYALKSSAHPIFLEKSVRLCVFMLEFGEILRLIYQETETYDIYDISNQL